MSRGRLSDYFKGVVFKTLTAVEANVLVSNQHEYNGTEALKRVMGTDQPRKFTTRFLLFGEDNEPVAEDGFLTWYDARARHPVRSEYRLYFPTNSVTSRARAGDAIFIGRRPDDEMLVVVAPAGSTVRGQLLWLFGLDEDEGQEFEAREFESQPRETDFVARLVLGELGIDAEGPAEEQFDSLIDQFGLAFPSTREFSAFARGTLPKVDPLNDPDAALLAWIEREEQLFRRLERRIVAERLRAGFAADDTIDVDGFLSFSLSVQNRRKARAGAALENHVQVVFQRFDLTFQRGAETENRNRPDFLFPGSNAYRNPDFPAEQLLMLGSKTTCKDRWRQVLSEAERIREKHLLTLEPGISETQTNEMKAKHLCLVIPARIHETYRPAQRSALITLADFVGHARDIQQRR